MAQEGILEKLWEITQENSSEEIEQGEFKKAVSISVENEIKRNATEFTNINDEYSRVLSIMLGQAKDNPESLGKVKNGSFSISTSIISKALKTVKYENQFIPGTQEYSQRELQNNNVKFSKEIVLTEKVMDSMINNFEKLNYSEKQAVLDNYPKLSRKQRDNIDEAIDKEVQKYKERMTEEERKKVEELRIKRDEAKRVEDIIDKWKKRDKLSEEEKEFLIEYNKRNPGILEFDSQGNLINCKEKDILGINQECNQQTQQEIDKTRIRDAITLLSKESLEKDEPEILKEILQYFELNFEECINNPRITIETLQLKKIAIEGDLNKSSNKSNIEEKKINDSEQGGHEISLFASQFVQNNIDTNKVNENPEGKIDNSSKENFEKKDFSKAINIYQEYFSDVDEETIEALKETEIDTIILQMKQDFEEMKDNGEIDRKTNELLSVITGQLTRETIDILLDSQKRDAFLEKMQSEVMSQGRPEKITDSELAELFERASVDLQVADATQVKEEGAQTTELDSSYIEESDVNTMHLRNSVPMQVDTVFERLCDEALQEGAVLDNDAYEKLLQEYMNEQGLKKVEAKSNAPETKGEKAGEDNEHANSELPPIFENQNNLDETIVDSNVSKDSISEFTEFEEYVDEDGNTKKVAGLKKDEKGDITDVTVFNPLNFVKISGVTTAELQEQVDMVKTLTQERTAVTENKKDEHEDVIE